VGNTNSLNCPFLIPVLGSDDQRLKNAYDACIKKLASFRTFHKDWIVKEYVLIRI